MHSSVSNKNTILLMVIILLTCSSKAWPTDEDTCELEEKLRVQIVFCFDRTGTFSGFLKQFKIVAPELTTELEKEFKGSEFGITAFADYPHAEEPRAGTEFNLDACYHFQQELTTNQDLFREKTSLNGISTEGGAESSLAAVMFTALDKRIGWNNGERDQNGILVKKIIVLVTDEYYISRLRKPRPDRKVATGDGTDTCTNALPPTIPVVGKVLRRTDISVIGLLAATDKHTYADLLKYYGKHFEEAGVPFSAYELSTSNLKTIPRDVINGVRKRSTCVWADPPAYNTLGL